MRPHGERDDAPRRFEWQGRIDLGHYLICRIAVLSIVDHGVGEDPCARVRTNAPDMMSGLLSTSGHLLQSIMTRSSVRLSANIADDFHPGSSPSFGVRVQNLAQ